MLTRIHIWGQSSGKLVSRKFDHKKRRTTSTSRVFKVHHWHIRDASLKVLRSARLMAEITQACPCPMLNLVPILIVARIRRLTLRYTPMTI